MLSVPVLAALCLEEIDTYRQGESRTDTYSVELLRRATIQGDQEAWAWMHHCFHELVRCWLRRHPSRETVYRLESEENYVAQAFERFWQATTVTQQVDFKRLAAALQYLRASLNGAIWIRCGLTRGQKKRRCQDLGILESHTWKTQLTVMKSGISSKRCYLVSVSSVWPTCSITVVSNRERLCASVKRSGAMYKRSIVCGATSWNDYSAMRIISDDA
jgi:hypothetical protein